MNKSKTIIVKNTKITIISQKDQDYISLTDMIKGFEDGLSLIEKWLRNKNTVEFLGIWEQLNNPDFNSPEFEGIKKTNATGLLAKTGRYGSGTFAHKDIAFEFGSWLNPEFKLYLIKEFQRLKNEEQQRLSLEWNLQRTLAKVNYRIHTDAIKENLIPKSISKQQINSIYASEADMLNVALFGKTAQQWHNENPEKEGNIRDYASLEQLVVLSNLESINSVLLHQGIEQYKRLIRLNDIAIKQMKSLISNNQIKKLK